MVFNILSVSSLHDGLRATASLAMPLPLALELKAAADDVSGVGDKAKQDDQRRD